MTINPHQKAFFEERAERWDEICIHNHNKIEYILDFLHLNQGDHVLDVGTGTGVLIPFLSQRVGKEGHILAIDYSENMIAVAQRKFPPSLYPQVDFIAQDICNYTIKPEFDAIICFSCFPHFIDQRSTLAHLVRGLKSKGRLMIAHENSRDFINNLHNNAGKEVQRDFLPAMDIIYKYMRDLNLKVIAQLDTEEYFLICAESDD